MSGSMEKPERDYMLALLPGVYARVIEKEFLATAVDFQERTGKRPERVRISQAAWDLLHAHYDEFSKRLGLEPVKCEPGWVTQFHGITVEVVPDFEFLGGEDGS